MDLNTKARPREESGSLWLIEWLTSVLTQLRPFPSPARDAQHVQSQSTHQRGGDRDAEALPLHPPNDQITQITQSSIHTRIHATADTPDEEAVRPKGGAHEAIAEEHVPRTRGKINIRRRRPIEGRLDVAKRMPSWEIGIAAPVSGIHQACQFMHRRQAPAHLPPHSSYEALDSRIYPLMHGRQRGLLPHQAGIFVQDGCPVPNQHKPLRRRQLLIPPQRVIAFTAASATAAGSKRRIRVIRARPAAYEEP